MAIVTGPLHSSEARGSVGALTYVSWRGRAVVRSRAGPGVYYTEAQMAARARSHMVMSLWSTLSNVQRELWNDYASRHLIASWTGTGKRLSGSNWFLRVNFNRVLLGHPISAEPPFDTVLNTLVDFSADRSGPNIIVFWSVGEVPYPEDANVDIWWVGPHTPGRHPPVELAKRVLLVEFEGTGSSFPAVGAGVYTLFGRVMLASGLVGPWQSARVTWY